LYTRQSATSRIRAIVDVKNKKSPKAFERVLWVKGLQTVMKCDRAIIATTDNSPSLVRFAQSQSIAVLSKDFLDKLAKKLDMDDRFTLEQLFELINSNPSQKQDGDWIRVLGEAKSAVASQLGFPAFNRAMFAFKFFAERVEVRTQHREAALRCALISASIACIALDIGLERLVFSDVEHRYAGLMSGVQFGDAGDGRNQSSIQTAIEALSEGMQNGRAIAAQARQQLERRLEGMRADVIAEYFMREHNAQHLFQAARELDATAHTVSDPKAFVMSIETRSILAVFADFVGVKRNSLPVSADVTVAASNVKSEAIDHLLTPSGAPRDDEVPGLNPSMALSPESGLGVNSPDGFTAGGEATIPDQRPLL